MTATETIERRDSEELTARRFADVMLHMLQDFIPEACYRDACQRLFETAMNEKFELTTLAMRNEYLAWKEINFQTLPAEFSIEYLLEKNQK